MEFCCFFHVTLYKCYLIILIILNSIAPLKNDQEISCQVKQPVNLLFTAMALQGVQSYTTVVHSIVKYMYVFLLLIALLKAHAFHVEMRFEISWNELNFSSALVYCMRLKNLPSKPIKYKTSREPTD